MKTLLIGLIALLLPGCATQTQVSTPDPFLALEAYHRALSNGDVPTAYAFLGDQLKQRMTYETFERFYKRHRRVMTNEAASLVAKARDQKPTEEAWVSVGDTEVHLVQTAQGWRLTAPMGSVEEEKAPSP
jgi:hypothetical protein